MIQFMADHIIYKKGGWEEGKSPPLPQPIRRWTRARQRFDRKMQIRPLTVINFSSLGPHIHDRSVYCSSDYSLAFFRLHLTDSPLYRDLVLNFEKLPQALSSRQLFPLCFLCLEPNDSDRRHEDTSCLHTLDRGWWNPSSSSPGAEQMHEILKRMWWCLSSTTYCTHLSLPSTTRLEGHNWCGETIEILVQKKKKKERSLVEREFQEHMCMHRRETRSRFRLNKKYFTPN
jgi:hypothetical protein